MYVCVYLSVCVWRDCEQRLWILLEFWTSRSQTQNANRSGWPGILSFSCNQCHSQHHMEISGLRISQQIRIPGVKGFSRVALMTFWTNDYLLRGAVLCTVRWLAASLDSTQSPDMLQVSRGWRRGGQHHPQSRNIAVDKREPSGEAVVATKTQSQIIE